MSSTAVAIGRLAEIEAEIESLKTSISEGYRKVGTLLCEVRDSKLYKEQGFATFEDYTETRWEISRVRAYQLIKAANTARSVYKILYIPTDSAARELSKATPKDQKKAARALAKSGKPPTAKNVKAAVEKVAPKREPKREHREPHEEPARQRGGLAAVVRESKAAEKASANGHAPEPLTDAELLGKYPLLTLQVCAQAARLIEAWYMRERRTLNDYPLATPERVKSLIVKVLSGLEQSR